MNVSAVIRERHDQAMNTRDPRASGDNHLMTPGTWLAEVSRDRTINIVERLNLLIAGIGRVRDRILIGVDTDGKQPCPDRPRADGVADTAELALEDLVLLRDITAATIHAVAAAAITGGADQDAVMKWAHYDADDRGLLEGVDDLLSRDHGRNDDDR
jgi:hypothetical protein